MNFMDIFVPMTAAFIVASIAVEFLHFLLGLWLSKRQQAHVKKHYRDMAEKMGVDPEDFMAQIEEQMVGMGMFGEAPGMAGNPMGNVMTTTSGGGEEHGQYL